MSDRIGVLQVGRLQQVGTPGDIYEQPTNPFVADFTGETNLLLATLAGADYGMIRCRLDGGTQVLAEPVADAATGRRVTLSLRPERIIISGDGASGLAGRITECVYRGTDTSYRVKLADGPELAVRTQNVRGRRSGYSVGDDVGLLIASGAARILTESGLPTAKPGRGLRARRARHDGPPYLLNTARHFARDRYRYRAQSSAAAMRFGRARTRSSTGDVGAVSAMCGREGKCRTRARRLCRATDGWC